VTYVILFGSALTFQVWKNYINKSTKGFSTDYALTGFVGFFFLVFNQTIGKIDPTTDAGRVNIMDLIFALQAFVCSSCAYTQTMIYPSHRSLRSTRVIVGTLTTVFLFGAVLETQFNIPF
jgi:hypothetical protein